MNGGFGDSFGDPDERDHPDVNSAPQWRRSPMEGGSIALRSVCVLLESPPKILIDGASNVYDAIFIEANQIDAFNLRTASKCL